MESYLEPTILIPILLCLAGGAFYFIYTLINKKYPRKSKEQGKDDTETEDIALGYEPILARIADNILGLLYTTTIPADKVKKIMETYHTLGRQWARDGKQIYGMVKMKDGGYKPITPPSQITAAPGELHNDMNYPDLEMMMEEDLTSDKSFIEKYGQVLWWVAVMGFLMLMWTQS